MVASAGVQAQAAHGAPPGRSERAAEHRALSDSVRRVERETNDQVLSAERVQFDGRDVNRVKIIDNSGRVKVYWDDPQARRADRDQQSREMHQRRERSERPERADVPRRVEPARQEEPQRRTRRRDGAAFNL